MTFATVIANVSITRTYFTLAPSALAVDAVNCAVSPATTEASPAVTAAAGSAAAAECLGGVVTEQCGY